MSAAKHCHTKLFSNACKLFILFDNAGMTLIDFSSAWTFVAMLLLTILYVYHVDITISGLVMVVSTLTTCINIC